MEESNRAGNAISIPCIENPFRVSLYCNGHYLWCLHRGGKLRTRKRKAMDKDEFQLIETDNNAYVMLVNHKFGSVLSVIYDSTGTKRVRCVPQEQQTDDRVATELNYQESMDDTDDSEDEKDEADEEQDDDENDENDDEGDIAASKIPIESLKWQLMKQVDGYMCMKNVRTGDRLGIDDKGRLVLIPEDSTVDSQSLWRIEPVTGELCFLSNVTYEARIRCDMSGRLSMSANWKGWEIFRVLEAGDGFVKIVSWTHSQWMLQCNADGKLQTGTHSVSHSQSEWSSVWAIESAPAGNGVVIRSERYGRFLCVYNSGKVLTIGTYHPLDEVNDSADIDNDSSGDAQNRSEDYLQRQAMAQKQNDTSQSQADFLQQAMVQKENTAHRNRKGWFRRRVHDATVPEHDSQKNRDLLPSLDIRETILWRLEAAHLQHYFLSTASSEQSLSKSVGPFPKVTSNLRKTDKFHLIRKVIGEAENTSVMAKLYHLKEGQYVACSSDGQISLTRNAQDIATEWMMINSDESGGSSFQSRHFGFYLSRAEIEVAECSRQEEGANIEKTGRSTESLNKKHSSSKGPPQKHLANLFQKKNKDGVELAGSKELGPHECWDLGPCVPRAVNSKKVRSFAIGTSLVLGSSVALPFALVGAGAMLHIGGNAGVAYHLVLAGISSADAVSSLGALGATAYLVFRPQHVSLTDQSNQSKDEESEQDRARFNRPFCDWRNWDSSDNA
jgi:hypothetical protein